MAVALNRRPRTPTAAALRSALLRLAGIARYRPVQPARLRRAWPDSLPLHFIRRISLPLSFRLGLCFLCDPHDALTASGKLGLLRVDAACGLISADLQLIESGGAYHQRGQVRQSRTPEFPARMPGTLVPSRPGSCWPDLPGLQFELGRGGVRFFVPGLRLTLGRPRSALADGGLLLAVDRAVLTPSELERSSRLGLTWANGVWLGCCPQVKRALPTRSGGCRSGSAAPGPRLRPAAWLAVPAGVGLGDGQAEFFEFGDELAQAAVVVEPGLVVGELLAGQDAGGGLAVFLAGPLVVGAVQPGRVGVAAAVRRPQRVIRSARVPGREKPRAASSRAMRRAWARGRGGRHAVIVAAEILVSRMHFSISAV